MPRRHTVGGVFMTEDQTPTEKLETASEHQDRAQRLINEARTEAEEAVVDALPFEADVDSTYLESTDSVRVTVFPNEMPDAISEIEDGPVVTQPLALTFGEEAKTDGDRVRDIKTIISQMEENHEQDEGVPIEKVLLRAQSVGIEKSKAEHEVEKLRQKGDVYEPKTDHLRTV